MRKMIKRISLVTALVMVFSAVCTYARGLDSVMGNMTDYSSWKTEAPVSAVLPEPLPSPAEHFREVEIGRAVTYYETYESQANRNTNMIVATQAVDSTLLSSGEIFSFNRIVGPRTEERGFKIATVFVGKEKVPGLGGGICQISSTIYMAVKKAGLEVVERYPHTLPVTYCSRDDEAAVSWGTLDFRFKNSTPHQLRIEAVCSGGVVRVVIYQRVPI